jgi:hypothetical protein
MTRSSAVWATDAEAKTKDIADDKPTLSKASTPIPFDDGRDDDDAELFDAEAGWYVPLSILIFTRPKYSESRPSGYDATKRFSRNSALYIRQEIL